LGLIVFAVAFAIRLVHVWQIRPSPFFDILLGDAHGYDAWARRLAAGDWIGTEVFYQAPLYPYFLGALYTIAGPDLLTVRIAQAAIGSASCALLAMAGARLFSKPVGMIAGLALAFYAPAIFFDGLLQKSVLDMLFVCLGLWLISRILTGAPSRGSWLALGLAMGGLALTRENALVFIAVIVVWIIVRTRPSTLGTLGTFALGLAIVLVPVASRNYYVGGGFYLTTSQFGPNLYIGNHAGADGTYSSIRFGRGAPEFERQDAQEVAERAAGIALSPAQVSSYWTERALEFMTSRPGEWLTLMGRKAMLLVNADEMLDTESQESYAEWSWPLEVLGVVGHFGVLVPLAVLGAIVTWPQARRLWVVHAMAIAYGASVVMFYVFARYRYPLVPFLLLFAAASFSRGWPRWQPTAAAVAVAIVANWPLLSAPLMQAITENNLATALQERKRYDEAIAHHQRAIALQPDYAPAHNNLGAALRAVGRVDEAIAHYQRALELRPDYPGAAYNLGIAFAAKGDFAGAIAALRMAVAIDEHSVQAHRSLGNLLVDRGARVDGLAHLERAAAIAPDEGDANFDLGTILLGEQDFTGAAERFERALRARPEWAEARNNLGIALASQGRLMEALGQFESALKARPDYAEARANRDQARAALGLKEK
jgi:tetratricopeptide (TPR) repeat protein